jgi:hypothetical protein
MHWALEALVYLNTLKQGRFDDLGVLHMCATRSLKSYFRHGALATLEEGQKEEEEEKEEDRKG